MNLFKRKKRITEETLLAHAQGLTVSIEDVPDPTFGQKLIGDGVAIQPTEGKVFSPIDAEIVQLFPTKHAIGLKTVGGLEILIHIGLETVTMEGEGFEAHIQAGDKVKAGDLLISFDLDLVNEKAVSSVIPMVITNPDAVKQIDKQTDLQNVTTQTNIMNIQLDN
ncbi:PTS sugar transporter subunit IIA [Virgibacillus salexigens]|uniref:PTS sugar transporter subunit IIA n=1 Tax=Virgibacillus salexigens TaxID=61016 RepID=UPI001F18535E|nr:PTS glucose transporter subunit IIA [Virgibacillus salexigens]